MAVWWVSDNFVEFIHVFIFWVWYPTETSDILKEWTYMHTVECSQLLGCTWTHKHDNLKRSLLRLQGQLFWIMTIRTSWFLAFFVLVLYNPVFNYAVTFSFVFFFPSVGHLPQTVHTMGSVCSKKVIFHSTIYASFSVCFPASALENYRLGCCLWR